MSNAHFKNVMVAASLAGALTAPSRADLLTNGSFESGLAGWTRADQVGSDGSFFSQSGASSPVNAFSVAAPALGSGAAMTDSTAGGSHVLYQDFVVPAGPITLANVGFSLYFNNHATAYSNPATLDWASFNTAGALNLNQQARVDIITTTANPFSVGAADVLQNLFRTTAATPLVSGYNASLVDITALLQAHAGETLRLRFAETDNVNFFNFGVDAVSINTVPSPSAAIVGFLGFAAAAGRRRRR